MTAPELKPCPFCGAGDPEWLANHVVCECGATGPRQNVDREYQADALQALRDWNRRADLAAVPAIDPAAIREAALREAAAKCEYTIRNIQILKSDGETYETPRVQKIARGLVDVARQEILALIGEKK